MYSPIWAILLLTFFLGACSNTSRNTETTTIQAIPVTQTSVSDTETVSETLVPLSSYSTEGLKKLEALRSTHASVNEFLERNRKPDYFFSTSSQKCFLIYLDSDNLYLFTLNNNEPYKKFHPIPASIKTSISKVSPEIGEVGNPDDGSTNSSPHFEKNKNSVENTLNNKNPSPALDDAILQSIPMASSTNLLSNTPIYPKLYYLDKSVRATVENDYSAKYDAKKQKLKLIIPQAYEGGGVYHDKNIDARKIYLNRDLASGKETVLIVPDFFPGSKYYRNTRGKVLKAFGSLYEVDVPSTIANNDNLHFRYSIKLCQKDNVLFCAYKSNGNTYIRAIIISAALYDSSSNTVIDTFELK